jgi:membrane-associated phospholipid phosphatase
MKAPPCDDLCMRVVQYVAVHWQSRVRQRLQTGSVALGKDQLGRCGLLHPGFDSPYGHAVHLSTRTCAPDEAHGCHHRPLADLVVASLRLASPRKRRILGQRSLCDRFMLGLLRWCRRCCHDLTSLAKRFKGIAESAERACSCPYITTQQLTAVYTRGAGGTGMAGLVKQLRNSSHLRWVAPALLVDWIVVIVVNLLAQWVELQYPYKRDPAHYLDDPSLQWPVTEEHVPAGPHSALDNYTFWLPVVVILVVGGIFKRSLHDVHHGFLVFMSSRTLMRVVVECLKNRVRKHSLLRLACTRRLILFPLQVGRLRPDFFSRCQWDAVAHACRGPLELVKDGRRSFPSGHSSTSWQAMLFLSLYLAGKNGTCARPRVG